MSEMAFGLVVYKYKGKIETDLVLLETETMEEIASDIKRSDSSVLILDVMEFPRTEENAGLVNLFLALMGVDIPQGGEWTTYMQELFAQIYQAGVTRLSDYRVERRR